MTAIGIPTTLPFLGCFADADFPAPTQDHYLCNRAKWFEPLGFTNNYEELPRPEDEPEAGFPLRNGGETG